MVYSELYYNATLSVIDNPSKHFIAYSLENKVLNIVYTDIIRIYRTRFWCTQYTRWHIITV